MVLQILPEWFTYPLVIKVLLTKKLWFSFHHFTTKSSILMIPLQVFPEGSESVATLEYSILLDLSAGQILKKTAQTLIEELTLLG